VFTVVLEALIVPEGVAQLTQLPLPSHSLFVPQEVPLEELAQEVPEQYLQTPQATQEVQPQLLSVPEQ